MSVAAQLDSNGTQGSGARTAGSRPAWLYAFAVAWLALAVFGLVGIVQRLLLGEQPTAYSSYIPWGLWVAAYIYFGGLSAGAFLVSSLVYVFGIRRLAPIGPIALYTAAVTLVLALLSILFDLGHMERFWEVFARPQFHSMMAWMVWLYTAYFVVLLAQLVIVLRARASRSDVASQERDRARLRVIGTIGVVIAIGFEGGVGALFGTVVAREYWNTAISPIIFLTGALASGAALMTAIVVVLPLKRDVAWRDLVAYLSRAVIWLVLLDLVLEFAEYSIPAWYQVGSEYNLITYVLFGPYWYVFWIAHVLFGVVIPVALLTRRNPLAQGIGAALVAITFFAVRLNMVIPGLISPELQGLEHAYLDPIGNRLVYSYVPSLFEWQVTAGIIAFGIAAFVLGYRFLQIAPPDQGITEEGEAR